MSNIPLRPPGSSINALYSHIATSKEGINASASHRKDTVEEMRCYLEKLSIDYKRADHHRSPRILHITGTKGKGSTTCMAESLCRLKHGLHTGMFTSPHLISPRERIQLDGLPISEEEFDAAYWHVFDQLETHKTDELRTHPGYFRFLTLIALHVFKTHFFPDGKRLDVVLLEVGMGGRYDPTNVLESADACAVTKLDLDHTRILGDTLEKIAWEKGGIMKTQSVCFSAAQLPGPTKILQECSSATNTNLTFIDDPLSVIDSSWNLGLKGSFQRENAAIAVMLTRSITGGDLTSGPDPAEGAALKEARWPGRCQRVEVGACSFLLDGAHTEKSMEVCLDWFCEEAGREVGRPTVLLFNCSHERSPIPLLEQIKSSRTNFDKVIFSPSDTERPSAIAKPTASELLGRSFQSEETAAQEAKANWQETLAAVWTEINGGGDVVSCANLQDAIAMIKEEKGEGMVLCTGSLYIVGSVLNSVGWSWGQRQIDKG
ncbi:hypothetical protein TrST_g7768 [Triparma strigata]|uniref:tetrahydrofolate synthase n=1 Tax=Triparma strigata TaxID=1606541 RepID=A0A9W7BY88_9STRA|nr:hypothetical protein TrST_g7768 [Triparma strigata]